MSDDSDTQSLAGLGKMRALLRGIDADPDVAVARCTRELPNVVDLRRAMVAGDAAVERALPTGGASEPFDTSDALLAADHGEGVLRKLHRQLCQPPETWPPQVIAQRREAARFVVSLRWEMERHSADLEDTRDEIRRASAAVVAFAPTGAAELEGLPLRSDWRAAVDAFQAGVCARIATAFRATFLGESGVWAAWEKHNGAAQREHFSARSHSIGDRYVLA